MNKKKVAYNTFLHLLLIVGFATSNPILIGAFILLSLITILKNFVEYQKTYSNVKYIAYIYMFCVLFSLFNFLRNDFITFHVILVLIYFFIAIQFSSQKLVYYYSFKYSFIILQIFVIGYAINFGFGSFPVIVPFDLLIESSSANGITSYAVFLQINYSILKYHFEKKIAYKTVLLTCIIALMGYGRGSILSSFLILFISLFAYLISRNKFNFLFYITVIILLGTYLLNYYFDSIFYFIKANTKLTAGLVDSARKLILLEYLNLMDGFGLLFGVGYENSIVESKFNGNPHNSFIRAHHIFGLPYLLFVIFYPIKVFFKNRNKTTVFFNIGLLLVLFFRAFSEPIIFPTLLDIYILTTIIIIDNKK
ncbi:hypothetical protein [Winogradskyella sp.]|uniref:hypothetical protein n=1 Tax=Winogradskyella sp. TaxID=1883156 RepID=UPI003AB4CF93